MADSIEQKIVEALVERLKGIDGTGDYQTTIAVNGQTGEPNVKDSQPNWDEESGDLPAVSIFQGTVSVDEIDDESLEVRRRAPFLIKWFLKRGVDASNARQAIQDTMTAIRLDRTWTTGGEQLGLTFEKAHQIEYVGEGNFEVVGALVEIEILYWAHTFNMES